MELIEGKILKVSGPLVIAEGMKRADMFDVVHVGKDKLIGEIIEMHGDRASVQVYEETAGLGRGDVVASTGAPLSVELGPGLIGNIYDGIQRPLEKLREMAGSNLTRGIVSPALDREKVWHFEATAQRGARVGGGDILGTVNESEALVHKVMVPPGMKGTLLSLRTGDYRVTDKIGTLEDDEGNTHDLTLMQKWPVRVARPHAGKLPPTEPMVTGQRSIDSLFPIARGGTACVPGTLRFGQNGRSASARKMEQR